MPQLPADEKIWEALEVCRPDSDESPDPALARLLQELTDHPELRRRYERIRDFDAQLADLFRDVPVPHGLAEKIKSKINPAGTVIPDETFTENPALKPGAAPSVLRWSTTAAETNRALPRRRAVSRRWFFVAGGLVLGGAVALLIVFFAGLGKTASYTHEMACGEAIRFFEDDVAKPGTILQVKRPPGDFPFSHEVIERRGIRWRKISDFLGREGVAFDLPSLGGNRATLYVVSLTVEDILPVPSLSHLYTTGGCAADAWQEDGLLYVLVVQGGKSEFNSCLKPQSPLA
jgi:hypothetical protein